MLFQSHTPNTKYTHSKSALKSWKNDSFSYNTQISMLSRSSICQVLLLSLQSHFRQLIHSFSSLSDDSHLNRCHFIPPTSHGHICWAMRPVLSSQDGTWGGICGVISSAMFLWWSFQGSSTISEYSFSHDLWCTITDNPPPPPTPQKMMEDYFSKIVWNPIVFKSKTSFVICIDIKYLKKFR